MALYKVGDVVTVIETGQPMRSYRMADSGVRHCMTPEMLLFAGRQVEIISCRDGGYRIRGGGGYLWTDEMFEETYGSRLPDSNSSTKIEEDLPGIEDLFDMISSALRQFAGVAQ